MIIEGNINASRFLVNRNHAVINCRQLTVKPVNDKHSNEIKGDSK